MTFALFDFIQQRAEIAPERCAVEHLLSGLVLNYGELNERTGRTAALLKSMGLQPGSRLVLLCRNRIEFFELLFACARLQAILVPLNWRMPASELKLLIEDCGAQMLLHGAEDTTAAKALAGEALVVVDIDATGGTGFAARRDAQQSLTGHSAWNTDDTWYLLYTSGTTGKPKAVIQTFGMAFANYVNISQGMGLRVDDTTLCFLPLFHSAGINLTALPALIMGARVLFTPGFELQQTIELLEQGRLNTFFGVPAIYQAFSLHPRFDQLDLSRVRNWACGGAAISDELLQRFAARGAQIQNGMGMTETGPTAFLMDAANASRKIGSVGKPQLLCRVRLVDPDGQDAAPGATGEVWFSGAGITPGYYQQAAATAEALPDGVWLRSGDLGRQDEDGYYYIVGRLKDMYISGGENVYAAELENHLASHPAILEAAVIGVADSKWGETGCAFVLPRPGNEAPELDELRQFLGQKLAAYKLPRHLVPVEEFPRTAAGKIQKHLLTIPKDFV
ncbi:MAG: AMP-binding protein [Xanthomonadales bacterium]|nr:AMP-binding protein [Xanthomonadales bacterium]